MRVEPLLPGTIDNGLIIIGRNVHERNMMAGALIVTAMPFGGKRSAD